MLSIIILISLYTLYFDNPMAEHKPNNFKTKRSRPLSQGLNGCHQQEAMRRKVMPPVFHKGEVFRAKLAAKHSSFTKVLSKSHVSSPFWMKIPTTFGKKHLPQNDTCITLENQNGKEYKARYLAEKTALSGGWRGFAIAEGFSEGDALVFHLVSPTKFKVYRMRKNDSAEADAMQKKMDTSATSCHPGNAVLNEETQHDLDEEMVLSEYTQRFLHKKGKSGGSNSKSRIMNSINLDQPASVGNFNDTTSFEDFIILLDDVLKKEYELPQHIKWSYYQLCCGQNVLLHANLPKGSNPILIAGVIIQTVNIAKSIRNIELPFNEEEFAILDQNLHALEVIGMNVGFMRTHVQHLRNIACDQRIALYRMRCKDLCSQLVEADKEMKNLQAKLCKLTQEYEKRVADIEKLKSSIENHELMFQEQVNAPW